MSDQTLPPFPADYQDQVRAVAVEPPPTGPLEPIETTLAAWQAAADQLKLDAWLAERVQEGKALAAQGRAVPGTWADAGSRGTQAFEGWLAANRSLAAIADAAAAGQRIADAAVQRAVDRASSFDTTKAQPDYQAGAGFAKTAASAAPGGALVVMLFDQLASAFVKGPKTGGAADPLNDPTGEAFGRLPLELRNVLVRAAEQLPAWPAEDVVRAWIEARRFVGKLPLFRLSQEAKRRGLWPTADAQWPFEGNTHEVGRQLRAMIQVALQVSAKPQAGWVDATARALFYFVGTYHAGYYQRERPAYPLDFTSDEQKAQLDQAFAQGREDRQQGLPDRYASQRGLGDPEVQPPPASPPATSPPPSEEQPPADAPPHARAAFAAYQYGYRAGRGGIEPQEPPRLPLWSGADTYALGKSDGAAQPPRAPRLYVEVAALVYPLGQAPPGDDPGAGPLSGAATTPAQAYQEGFAWGAAGQFDPGIVQPYQHVPALAAAWSQGWHEGLDAWRAKQQPAPALNAPSSLPPAIPAADSGAAVAVGLGVGALLLLGVGTVAFRRRRRKK